MPSQLPIGSQDLGLKTFVRSTLAYRKWSNNVYFIDETADVRESFRYIKMMFPSVLFSTLLLAANPQSSVAAESVEAPLYPSDLLQISDTTAFSKYVLLVDKKNRKLLVFERDGDTIKLLEDIPADIGKNDGNKEKANDHRTPEGIYFFDKKLTSPQIPFNLYGKMAFTTDYPNIFDRRLKKTGNGIWLHSVPETVTLTRGSRGCVVIRNEELAKVENYIKLRQTPMIVYDKIDYVAKDEHDRRRKELGDWLESWRAAWASQDIDRFVSFYAPDFKAPGFPSLNAWEKHKRRLAKQYKTIKVTLSQPFLLLHNEELIVKTLQKYESDKHTDYGVKVIHAVKTAAGYKIIHEEWTRADEHGETNALIQASENPAGSYHLPN